MVIRGKDNRVSKIDTYLNCAEVFAYRSTCIKRKYGAVIVKDDAVISTDSSTAWMPYPLTAIATILFTIEPTRSIPA